jgi:rfaE bifunctional protein nucleotidyltransferase chain/domain
MNRIVSIEQAAKISRRLKKDGKISVFTGGCFDILHLGHVRFLEAAKKKGDVLFVFVESDENVRKTKGDNRPINTQDERIGLLESIRFVDYVIKLPFMQSNADYDKLTEKIMPSIIAVTKGSNVIKHAERQAEKINAKVIEVLGRIPDRSTSKIARIISDENKL